MSCGYQRGVSAAYRYRLQRLCGLSDLRCAGSVLVYSPARACSWHGWEKSTMDVRAILSARASRLGEQGARLAVFHGGDMSMEVAGQVKRAGVEQGYAVSVLSLDAFGSWVAEVRLGAGGGKAPAVLLATTVEDFEPDDATAGCLKFLRHRTSAEDAGPSLAGLSFAVLGLGDSNLLAASHRSITWATAKDCNHAAQDLDLWLEQQGGTRFKARGEADDRTGNLAVSPWVAGVWPALAAIGGSG